MDSGRWEAAGNTTEAHRETKTSKGITMLIKQRPKPRFDERLPSPAVGQGHEDVRAHERYAHDARRPFSRVNVCTVSLDKVWCFRAATGPRWTTYAT